MKNTRFLKTNVDINVAKFEIFDDIVLTFEVPF